MIKPAKLFLIRHAPVKSNSGFFSEHDPDAIIVDSQLKKLSKVIPSNCTWYISPLKRAVQTARALSNLISYSKIIEEKRLAEQNFGDWSGKKISEIWEILKKYKTKHNFSFITPDISPPNGESYIEQCERVKNWIETLNYTEGENIVVIAHAGTIRAILSNALEIKPEKTIGIEILHYSLSVFEMLTKNHERSGGGKFRLITLNREV